uniref:Uncharacterized protein n=1 Tax=Oncorhynchus mykiss TaxID=8022 RepID=A0A8C7TGU8_ONCMY
HGLDKCKQYGNVSTQPIGTRWELLSYLSTFQIYRKCLGEVARGCLTTIFLVDCILPPSTYYTNYEFKLSSDCDGQSHTVSCPIFTLARGSSHKIIALTLVSFFHNPHIHGFICPRRTLKGKIAKQYPEAFRNAHESPVLEDDEFDPIPPSVATMITATMSGQSTESCDTSPDVISPNVSRCSEGLSQEQADTPTSDQGLPSPETDMLRDEGPDSVPAE